jgi:hypothetical protein
MSLLVVSKKTQGGEYNFATGGGAIGTIGLGVFIPNNAVINRFWVKTLATGVSGGGTGGFTFGIAGPAALVPLAAGAFIIGAALQGVDFDANPLIMVATSEITFTIAGFVWTAGRITFGCDYTEMDV